MKASKFQTAFCYNSILFTLFNSLHHHAASPILPKPSPKTAIFCDLPLKNPNKYGGLAKVEEKYKKSHDLYLQRLSKLPNPNSTTRCPFTRSSTKLKKPCRESGNDYLRRNRFGQNHAAAQDLFGTRTRGGGFDRAYPAAPFGSTFGGGADCRRAEIGNWQRGSAIKCALPTTPRAMPASS